LNFAHNSASKIGETMDPTFMPCCLIAEDQALIGMALEAYFEDLGIDVAGPFPSCTEAAGWVDAHTPEIAILDFKLKDGSCIDLARSLLARGVPVIIYSGISGINERQNLAGVTWLEKPADRATLLKIALRLAPSLACRMRRAAA
jgi:DNA-binding response OmpR family regulator